MSRRAYYCCGNWEQDDDGAIWGFCTHPDIPFDQIKRAALSEWKLSDPITKFALDNGLTGYLDTSPGFDGWPGWDVLPVERWMEARRQGLDLATLAEDLQPPDWLDEFWPLPHR
jgi:hypothetical protein